MRLKRTYYNAKATYSKAGNSNMNASRAGRYSYSGAIRFTPVNSWATSKKVGKNNHSYSWVRICVVGSHMSCAGRHAGRATPEFSKAGSTSKTSR
jgi:hypothetical protein